MMMKKKLLTLTACAAACLCVTFTACGSGKDYGNAPNGIGYPDGFLDGNYRYDDVIESGFESVASSPASYFSLDKNTATYSLVRRQIDMNAAIAPDSVRVEEMINYFDYSFPAPEDEAMRATAYVADCPWNADNKLMLVGLKTKEVRLDAANSNYVFLIDVSGSMSGDGRIGLAKKSVELLTDSLGDGDCLSIVTYANECVTVLDGVECTAAGKKKIRDAVSGLRAYGGTNGSGGLELAYRTARDHFITGGNNRVLLVSDGDFNIGLSNKGDIKEFIQDNAESGVYLSVLGVGMGNTRDDILQTLATCGNGNYAYLDNVTEAEKVLTKDVKGTLITVAKDAKAKVTFTDSVEKYRLIGYDTKLLSEDDYENENTDAGEIGSNLCVAALYEIELATDGSATYAEIEVSYKDVTGDQPANAKIGCTASSDGTAGEDLPFIGCVAEFGLLLRKSQYRGDASIYGVKERLDNMTDYLSADPYKAEFRQLVEKAIASEQYF